MRYAIIEDGTVSNVIVLYPNNATDFPDAVPCGELPVMIGDTYDGEHFYRNGEQVITPQENALNDVKDMQAALALLGVEEVSE